MVTTFTNDKTPKAFSLYPFSNPVCKTAVEENVEASQHLSRPSCTKNFCNIAGLIRLFAMVRKTIKKTPNIELVSVKWNE